jgi:hypothetical protein
MWKVFYPNDMIECIIQSSLENPTTSVYMCVYVYFKELAYMFVGSGKSKICNVVQEAENSVKVFVFQS